MWVVMSVLVNNVLIVRRILLLSAILLFGLVACSDNSRTTDEGVVIEGIRWATRNVNRPGTFAKNPESMGRLFTWEAAQDTCPRGWRVPTYEELIALHSTDKEWTTRNGVNGLIFGTAPYQIFLPAAGWQKFARQIFDVDVHGQYWSSMRFDAVEAMRLWFNINSGFSHVSQNWDWHKSSVRCVAK